MIRHVDLYGFLLGSTMKVRVESMSKNNVEISYPGGTTVVPKILVVPEYQVPVLGERAVENTWGPWQKCTLQQTMLVKDKRLCRSFHTAGTATAGQSVYVWGFPAFHFVVKSVKNGIVTFTGDSLRKHLPPQFCYREVIARVEILRDKPYSVKLKTGVHPGFCVKGVNTPIRRICHVKKKTIVVHFAGLGFAEVSKKRFGTEQLLPPSDGAKTREKKMLFGIVVYVIKKTKKWALVTNYDSFLPHDRGQSRLVWVRNNLFGGSVYTKCVEMVRFSKLYAKPFVEIIRSRNRKIKV